LISREIIRAEPLEAEIAKLFTNSWRYVQFAIANQFYMMAESYGLDFYKIYHMLTHNYPRAASYPQPGLAAGPCLFKDTMQLSAFHSNSFFLGHAAMLINEGLPDFLVRRLKDRVPLRRRVVGILGMAFKAESDDCRDSLSYKLAKKLRAEGAVVLCTDPYVQDPSLCPIEEVLKRAETLVLACPHREYAKLDLQGRDIVDPWGIHRVEA
jgi:UDP-N-acetyl-D-mannosaminuronic acid dehydrogenase